MAEVRHADVLIVGTGHGGAQAAIALRQKGFAGSIVMIGAESHPPYERPALSKDYLAGKKAFERLLLRPVGFWAERDIGLVLGERVVAVDPVAQRANTASGAAWRYGQLIWAAGGTPRRLACPGHDLPGVHAVRTRDDVDAILATLGSAERIGIVGGGYVGLEATAALVEAGKQVFLLEAQDRVMARVAGICLSRFYEGEHRARGVDIRLNTTVAQIAQIAGGGLTLRTNTGSEEQCDLVIVGVGIQPSVAPLLDAGADGNEGVAIDGACRTSLPQVFAIGDCAEHPPIEAGARRLRIESVQNANDQANHVATLIATGAAVPYAATPWFWSNQYDLRLQTVGLSLGHDEWVVRGDIDSRSFSIVYLRDGRVIAIDCVNCTKDYVQGRKLIEQGGRPRLSRLVDTSVPLKDAC
ncbi:FAD-dependent oxidoreductase [Sphingomonas paucimobilis]|uniref:NAD(P)/FAD-dependent oxidoreductase n=1 Tax=Sphingomonas paucimobilis TaxID=13689 RepID=UPI0028D2D0DB|nr:FAD-dependent oxidoreductase [Sphingomonas paucimobilis]